jgi:phenylalanyl-tRNA synthetase beta chain
MPTLTDHAYDFGMQLRQRLTAMGFYEARTSALVSEILVRQSYEGDLLRVRNPLGEEQAILRPSLVPELLGVVERNIRQGANAIRFFEIGRVFRPGAAEESLRVSLVMTGDATETTWRNENARALDLFDLKGGIERLSRGKVTFHEKQLSGYVLALEVLVNRKPAGFLAQLPSAKARALDARGAVVVAELEFEVMYSAEDQKLRTREIPKFPAVSRDIACVLSAATPYSALRDALQTAKEPLLVDVRLFDVFRDPKGEKLPADRKSLAFSLTFRSNERTLTSEEINAACDRLKAHLKKSLSVDFRE